MLVVPGRAALDTSQDFSKHRVTDLPGLGVPNVNLGMLGLGTATHAN